MSKSTLRISQAPVAHAAILQFYKGFKPTWSDVIHGVPAELDALAGFLAFFDEVKGTGRLIPIIGPAGSGKTTLLMQAAYQMSLRESTAVYFISEPVADLRKILEVLDHNDFAKSVIVVIDKIDFVSDQLVDVLKSGRLTKTILVGAERQNIWHRRTERALSSFSSHPYVVNEFTSSDATKILEKLEQFGSWTRLGQLSPNRQLHELISRAKSQLLIALLEATSGRGFKEIIESDYDSLTNDAERLYLILIGLATLQRLSMPIALAFRAMVQLSLAGRVSELSGALSGIIVQRGGHLSARHERYIRHLLEHHVDPSLVERAIVGLMQAFALNRAPVIQNIPKVDAQIYRATINHRFLFAAFHGKKKLVLGLYKSLEKKFERDGLFWLQYGLSLRDFNEQAEALEKLRNAVSAYPMDHTEHALAQQLLIMADGNASKAQAETYLDEAKAVLLRLDRSVMDSDDTYPIVTLAEGHTKIARFLEGDAAARAVAGHYANQVKQRLDEQPGQQRLRNCWEFLVKYAAIGTWPPEGDRELPPFLE